MMETKNKIILGILLNALFFSTSYSADAPVLSPSSTTTPVVDFSQIAINNLKKKIESDKNNPQLWLELSNEYSALNKPQEALEAITEAIKLNPKSIEYLNLRGQIYNWLKNPKLMQADYRLAHELDSNNQTAILGLARADVQLGQFKEADTLFSLYIDKNKNDKDAYIEYIELQIYLGDRQKARTLLETYKSHFGETEAYKKTLKTFEAMPKAPAKGAEQKSGKATNKKAAAPVVKNGAYYLGLSQNFSAKNQPKEALKAINKALSFEPKNVTYLKQRGEIAGWVGNLPVMQDSYQRILAISPMDPDATLGMARAKAWQGKTMVAIGWYKQYLQMRPKSKEALIELSDIYRQIEDFRQAQVLLSQYYSYFGETKPYRAELAYLYASANWYQTSLNLNAPLLASEPNNYNYLVTQAYAQYSAREYRNALSTFDHIGLIKPNGDEAKFLKLYLPVPVRSYIQLGQQNVEDTHTVRISETGLRGYEFFRPETALRVYGLFEYARATDPDFTPADGGQSVNDGSAMIGIFQRIAPYADIGVNIGGLTIQNNKNFIIDDVELRAWLNERFTVRYFFTHNLFRPDQYAVFSPRSISLAIMQNDNILAFHLEPYLQRFLDVYFEYNPLSDTNVLRHVNIWPSFRLFSLPGWTANLGASADLYSFTKTDLNDGYYSPCLAQTYLGTLNIYHGFNYNSGVTLSMGLGVVKDQTFVSFKPSFDVSVDAVVGFFSGWQFELIGGYSFRGSPTGAYQVWSGRGVLTRRF